MSFLLAASVAHAVLVAAGEGGGAASEMEKCYRVPLENPMPSRGCLLEMSGSLSWAVGAFVVVVVPSAQ